MHKPILDTKQFADLLGIKESELVFILMSNAVFKGQQLPHPIADTCSRTRRFKYEDVISLKKSEEINEKSISLAFLIKKYPEQFLRCFPCAALYIKNRCRFQFNNLIGIIMPTLLIETKNVFTPFEWFLI
ncbi:hypothetical protein [Serratia ficaria]|uniref:hypothetical protein n=1 Tax=Serratia ficaria TaxID=61651 RepID=UPI0012EEA795|nr:hypothetical protein [Serratia ficaria]